jgi:hypothetical protein
MQILDMTSTGQFWHHPTVRSMNGVLGRDDIGAYLATISDYSSRCFITRGLYT